MTADIREAAEARLAHPRRGWITTYTGKQFVIEQPTLEMIDIEDISHALAMLCHFAGHTAQFFSVAQHSICVARICPPELRQWGLMHDAAEAYIGDMTRPLKYIMPEYRIIEQRITQLIAEKFGMSWPEPPELKSYDDQIIKLEAKLFMNNAILLARDGELADIPDAPPLPPHFIAPMNHIMAKHAFGTEFRRIFLDDDGL